MGACVEGEKRTLTADPFDEGLVAYVQGLVSTPVKRNVPGAALTTYSIGGEVAALVTIESEAELVNVLDVLTREGQEFRVLGKGSNLLVRDGGVQAWVLRLGSSFRSLEQTGNDTVRLGAAASLMSVARKISENGLSGLEFAAGIPASVGGAAFMNAGAHGGEIGARVESVRAVLPDGTVHQWHGNELPWSYRCSGLPLNCVVTHVDVKLVPGEADSIASRCAAFVAERRARQPLSLPSAGSVFKNPRPDVTAGQLLEECGLKGLRVGGAEVSTLHANWIVNPERRATAADVETLMNECVDRVKARKNIDLESEIRVW